MIEDYPISSEYDDSQNQEESTLTETVPKISFHAMVGTNHPQNLYMIGKIKNREVMVLIDGVITHNFID